MKKPFVLLAITSLVGLTPVAAQSLKGTLFAGTSIGSTSYTQTTNNYDYADGGNKNTDAHAYSLSLSPSMGVFVTNHLIVGGSLGLSYAHNKTNSSNTEGGSTAETTFTNTTTVNLGPFLRYYFYENKPLRTMLYMQAQGTIGTGGGSSSGSGFNNATWTSGASLGVTHFIGRNVGMDFAIGYAHNYEYSKDNNQTLTALDNGGSTTKPNNYSLATSSDGFTLSVGFHWFFHPHGK
jgi:hypothetical protein